MGTSRGRRDTGPCATRDHMAEIPRLMTNVTSTIRSVTISCCLDSRLIDHRKVIPTVTYDLTLLLFFRSRTMINRRLSAARDRILEGGEAT
jgi:hypothetical protein